MNALDNLIGWISPEAGWRREAYRRALEESRGYDAASYGLSLIHISAGRGGAQALPLRIVYHTHL